MSRATLLFARAGTTARRRSPTDRRGEPNRQRSQDLRRRRSPVHVDGARQGERRAPLASRPRRSPWWKSRCVAGASSTPAFIGHGIAARRPRRWRCSTPGFANAVECTAAFTAARGIGGDLRCPGAGSAKDAGRVRGDRVEHDTGQRGSSRHSILFAIAFGEGRFADAVQTRASDTGSCTTCATPVIALARLRANGPTRPLRCTRAVQSTSILNRFGTDDSFSRVVQAPGELWEAKGDRAKTVQYYSKFINSGRTPTPIFSQRSRTSRSIARLDLEGR